MNTRRSLQENLEKAGILPADTVIVHSSMKKIGQVDGGANAVIDALIDYFSKDGLLVFPTLTYTLSHKINPESERCKWCLANNKPTYCLARDFVNRTPEFHVNSTPACIGLLPNVFMARPGVCRSINPTHSVAAIGRDAKDFTSGHENGNTPCGKHTPWWKLYLRSAKVLHLGSKVSNTTFMHGVDEWARTPDDMQGFLETQVDVYDHDERRLDIPPQHNTSGSSAKFPLLEEKFIQIGALFRFQFGDMTDAIAMDCRKLTDLTLDELKKNPTLFR